MLSEWTGAAEEVVLMVLSLSKETTLTAAAVAVFEVSCQSVSRHLPANWKCYPQPQRKDA